MWRINIPTLMASFEEIATFPPIDAYRFEGPVLFIGGGASDYIQYGFKYLLILFDLLISRKTDHDQILKMFPKAEFQYIEGAGHWLHSEKPTEFLQHTIDFLNK